MNGRRENKENDSDTENVTTDQNGNAEFTNSVADDEQTITIDDGNGNEISVTVTPGYDGENLGSLPIVEKGMYGFKTTYVIDSDDLGFCYGNNYKYYNLELDFNNIGDITPCWQSKRVYGAHQQHFRRRPKTDKPKTVRVELSGVCLAHF